MAGQGLRYGCYSPLGEGIAVTEHQEPEVDQREKERRDFAEEFSLVWQLTGIPRMDGRILGYLMVTPEPYLSSATLCDVLKMSPGAVSTSTRRMVEAGFIRRHAIPGDRNHYFVASDDPWGSYLASESPSFVRTRDVLDRELARIPAEDTSARRRVQNGRNYMEWIERAHKSILLEWEKYNREHNGTDEKSSTS